MPRAANSVTDNNFMLAQIAILLCVCRVLGVGPWLTIFMCIYWYNRVKEYIHDTNIILMREEDQPAPPHPLGTFAMILLLCVCSSYYGAGAWTTFGLCICWYYIQALTHDHAIILMREEDHRVSCVLSREIGWDSSSN